jgi:flagellar biosynthesis/type III secretory pathway protein FliH
MATFSPPKWAQSAQRGDFVTNAGPTRTRTVGSANASTPTPPPQLTQATPSQDSAPVDLDALVRDAYQRGMVDGRQSREAEVREARAEAAVINALIEELAGVRHAALNQASRDIADIVVALAERVVGASLSLHPSALPQVIEGALDRLPEDESVWIHVAARDEDRVRALLAEAKHVTIQVDPTVTAGCVVRTRYATIDATVGAVMEGVERAVQSWLDDRLTDDRSNG